VNPAFGHVTEEISEETALLTARAETTERLSDGGIVLIVLVAVAMVLAADRRRRAADRRRRADVEHLALHDPLTALPNRRLFLERVDATLRRQVLEGGSACLLYLDLDGFKAVNDAFGHAGGDELLIAATHRLKGGVHPTDTLCRLGGDEFGVLLEDVDERAGHRVGERLLGLLTEDFAVAGDRVRISASVGVAVLDGSWTSAGDVLHAADQAMYDAKRRGKNRVALFEADRSKAAPRSIVASHRGTATSSS
jgi:diguanylate cyclase (GGDEF)-like protein